MNFHNRHFNLRIFKRPCKVFDIKCVDPDTIFKYVSTESVEIKGDEMPDFLADTLDLILGLIGLHCDFCHGRYNVEYITAKTGQIIKYYEKWGELFPGRVVSNIPKLKSMTKGPQKPEIIKVFSLEDLKSGASSCFNYYVADPLWHEPDKYSYELFEGISNNKNRDRVLSDIYRIYNKPYESTAGFVYWCPAPEWKEGSVEVNWFPVKKSSAEESFSIFIKRPKSFEENKEEWVTGDNDDWNRNIKLCILNYIVKYMKAQKIKSEPAIINGKIGFEMKISNLFIAHMVFRLFNSDIKSCKCGCGRPIPMGRKEWATDKCRQKVKNSHPKRQLQNWLRGQIRCGKFASEKRDDLYLKIDELLEEGLDVIEIKARITNNAC